MSSLPLLSSHVATLLFLISLFASSFAISAEGIGAIQGIGDVATNITHVTRYTPTFTSTRITRPWLYSQIKAQSTTAQPIYGNPYDGECIQFPNSVTVEEIYDGRVVGAVCSKVCNSNEDCQEQTSIYSNANTEDDDDFTRAIAQKLCVELQPGENRCLVQTKPVFVENQQYAICPGSMKLSQQSSIPSYCHFTQKSKVSPYFHLLNSNQDSDKETYDENGIPKYWKTFNTLPINVLTSPFTKKVNSRKAFVMASQACISTTAPTSHDPQHLLCPSGTFCEPTKRGAICLPKRDNPICLQNGGTTAYELESGVSICTFTERRKFCTLKLEPWLNAVVTALTTWLLFILQTQTRHITWKTLKNFVLKYCCCCLSLCFRKQLVHEWNNMLPIEEYTLSVVERDTRSRKILNIVRRPIACITFLRAFWSIFLLYSSVIGDRDCIHNFSSFFYILFSQELTKQTLANGFVVIYTLGMFHVFGHKAGLQDKNILDYTLRARIGYILVICILTISIFHLTLLVFAVVVFLWPYYYILIATVLTGALLSLIVYAADIYSLRAHIAHFCQDINSNINIEDLNPESIVFPHMFTYSSESKRRTKSEMTIFAHLYVANFIFQHYLLDGIDALPSKGQEADVNTTPKEIIAMRAANRTKVNRLFSRISTAILEFMDTFNTPPVIEPSVLASLSDLAIRTLDFDMPYYFNMEVSKLLIENEKTLREYHTYCSIPLLDANLNDMPKYTNEDARGLSSTQFFEDIDKAMITKLETSTGLVFEPELHSIAPSSPLLSLPPQSEDSGMNLEVELEKPSKQILVKVESKQSNELEMSLVDRDDDSYESQVHSRIPHIQPALSDVFKLGMVEAGKVPLRLALDLTFEPHGLSLATGLRREILKEYIVQGHISTESFEKFHARSTSLRAFDRSVFDLLSMYERVSASHWKLVGKALTFVLQFYPWVLLMGCNFYYYTGYNGGFNLSHDRVSMRDYYLGYIELIWSKYFI